ncbi:hypothetical protein HOLleu_19529 [Holothuria leucospilota]|uniref:CCHC-type domain-containing protein n=1 Tax=Holothuria leucospilota TaxID=206669 RepID=A0A9Q1BZE4_HOLLE|nr:hypothetical protein HOLleu_19529 [Holothuria leucospilota]
MARLFGKLDEFNSEKEEWTQYVERLNHFFTANDITEETKKQSIFLSLIGADAYKLLRNLVSPEKPGDKTYKDLVEIMGKHQNPTPSETVQRCKFNSRFRKQGESVSSYVAELRAVAEYCNYGTTLNDMLRDRLVCGINNDRIQRNLLSKSSLTFETALEIAIGLEIASKNSDDLKQTFQQATPTQHSEQSVQFIPKGKGKVGKSNRKSGQKTACYRCGGMNHAPQDCWFKDKACNECGKIGHKAKVCRSKKVKQVNDTSDNYEPSQEPGPEYLFNVRSRNRGPITVQVKVNEKPLTMELDTGASLSLMSHKTFKKMWPNASLEETDVCLNTYTGEELMVFGMT